MILFKGKAKDYSLENLKRQVAERYGIILPKKVSISELELTAFTSKQRLEKWQKSITQK